MNIIQNSCINKDSKNMYKRWKNCFNLPRVIFYLMLSVNCTSKFILFAPEINWKNEKESAAYFIDTFVETIEKLNRTLLGKRAFKTAFFYLLICWCSLKLSSYFFISTDNYKTFNYDMLNISKTIFYSISLASALHYCYIIYPFKFVFDINYKLVLFQLAFFVIAILFTMLVILFVMGVVDLFTNYFITSLSVLSFISCFVIVYCFEYKLCYIQICLVIVLSIHIILFSFGKTLSKNFFNLNIGYIFYTFLKASNYIIPFFIFSSIISYFQMILFKYFVFKFAIKNNIYKDIKLLLFLESSLDMQPLFFIFLLGWSVFIINNCSKIYISSIFQQKHADGKVNFTKTVKLVIGSMNQIVYLSLLSSLVNTFQIFFSFCCLSHDYISFVIKYNSILLLVGLLNLCSSTIYSYSSALFLSIGLEFIDVSDHPNNLLLSYDPVLLKTSYQVPIFNLFKRVNGIYVSFTSIIPFTMVFISNYYLKRNSTMNIFILFICADLLINFLNIIYYSFFIANNLKKDSKTIRND